MWGNGVVLNNEMDYSNYYPKKIKNFSKEGSPVIISVRFGLYHEAYLDTEGKFHVCRKYKLPSKKIPDLDDGERVGFETFQVEGERIIDLQFTKNRIFGLTTSGKVYLWIIAKDEPKPQSQSLSENVDELFEKSGKSQSNEIIIEPTPYHIGELKNIISIKTGEDHFIGLDDEGSAWAMGEDKYGQCGQYHDNRPTVPPFKDVRIGKPQRVNCIEKFESIGTGNRHSFGITRSGRLYAWGYNHQIQISHGENLASATTHKQILYEPEVISREINGHYATHAVGGSDFSIIISEDRKGNQFFWGTGNNLRGQLGINKTTHIHDMEPMYFEDEPIEEVKFKFLSAGRRHSILALERGGLFLWGDNEEGQIGNKNRRVCPRPFLRPRFSQNLQILD